MNVKGIGAHLLTATLTLILAAILFGDEGTVGRFFSGERAEPPRRGDRSTPAPIEPVAPPELPPEAVAAAAADEAINVHVYEAVNKSVVNITTTATIRGLFRDAVTSGSGSGFFIDKKGHVLTNFHVIEDAEGVQVGLFDGSVVDAELVGVDPSNDLAVLRINAPAEKLEPVALGDSTNLKVGQKVLALGNPFGLERTLTTGVISSLDRSLEAKNNRMIKGIIQTDAAINPGNSGGPLLNSRGEVIGMNTAIYSQVGQSAGIGFAVPIDTVKRLLGPLIEHGRVVRADLGIARVYSMDEGLLVLDVVPDGPADRAGIRPLEVQYVRVGPYVRPRIDPESADILVAVEGVRVRKVSELLTEVESYSPGETITVTVVRGDRVRDVEVTLGRSG